jgi:L-threonylcarbamoyladenylate synthase
MLDRYIQLIKKGELVAFPTETVYGLGADAWNPGAVQKVFTQKGRPSDNPLIVHIANTSMVHEFTDDLSEDAQKLMQKFWPGPLTLIFKKKAEVLDLVTAGLNTVAIRWPSHPLSQDLIANTGPLVAPSANSSGKPSPTKPQHVRDDFGQDFPVIDAGETAIGLESTVLDVSKEPYLIYRPGAATIQEIEEVIGKKIHRNKENQPEEIPKSPGTKYSHYSPDAKVKWLDKEEKLNNPDTLYLLHSHSSDKKGKNIVEYNGDFQRFARELYDRFRQADHEEYYTVAIERFSQSQDHPLIPALKNRIHKAIG